MTEGIKECQIFPTKKRAAIELKCLPNESKSQHNQESRRRNAMADKKKSQKQKSKSNKEASEIYAENRREADNSLEILFSLTDHGDFLTDHKVKSKCIKVRHTEPKDTFTAYKSLNELKHKRINSRSHIYTKCTDVYKRV